MAELVYICVSLPDCRKIHVSLQYKHVNHQQIALIPEYRSSFCYYLFRN